MADQKKNIVVLGGGGAGIQVVRELCSKLPSSHQVILITDRDRYRHTPAMLRLVVKHDPNARKPMNEEYDNVFMPLDMFVKKRKKQLTLKIGKAERIETRDDGGTVVLQSGGREERVNFNYLVCATGLTWEGPLKALKRPAGESENTIMGWRVRFRNAKHVVLIGGGAVGLELAGELLDQNEKYWKSEKRSVTIVQRAELPLNNAYPKSFRENVRDRWQKRGVTFIFNDELETFKVESDHSITTKKGKVIRPVDLAVFVRGGLPNTKYLKDSRSLEGVLNDNGFVKVDKETLEVVGHSNIYALGDIADLPGQKTLAKTPKQASVVAANVLNAITAKAGKGKKKVYKGMFEGIFITNGENHGAGFLGILWGLRFGDKVVSMVKGKGLFVEMGKKTVDLGH